MSDEPEIGIVIIGTGGIGGIGAKAITRALLAIQACGGVIIDNPEPDKRLIVDGAIAICPLPNLGYPELVLKGIERDNSFRGGSRKKGGKVGYQRK